MKYKEYEKFGIPIADIEILQIFSKYSTYGIKDLILMYLKVNKSFDKLKIIMGIGRLFCVSMEKAVEMISIDLLR